MTHAGILARPPATIAVVRTMMMALVIGCGPPPSPPTLSNHPAPSASVKTATDQTVYCDLAIRMIDELAACTGANLDVVRNSMNRNRSLTPVMIRKNAAYCAQFMEHALLDPDTPQCKLTATPRGPEIAAFVDGYYAERTPVAPTGDERRDRALHALAKHRDDVCNCSDHACAREVVDIYFKNPIEPVGGDAPASVVELTDKLLDEVARCSSDLRFSRRKSGGPR